MKAYVWNDVSGDLGAHYDTTDIPADLQDKAALYEGGVGSAGWALRGWSCQRCWKGLAGGWGLTGG